MDKLAAMAAFVRVVERGSFSAVARELNTSQPNISRQVRALEQDLGGHLIERSTRQLSLTDEGQRYYRECRRILEAIDIAENSFKTGQEVVAGVLRVAAPVSFGHLQIAPRLGRFLALFPQLRVELHLNNGIEDLVAAGVDVALRLGALADSGLVARPVGSTHLLTVAAPEYLRRCGEPHTPQELSQHNCLVFAPASVHDTWTYHRNGERLAVPVAGNVRTDNLEAIRSMALSGLGVARSAIWHFGDDVRNGRLVRLLREYETDAVPIHAVFPVSRRQSARVRAFVDFLSSELANDPAMLCDGPCCAAADTRAGTLLLHT